MTRATGTPVEPDGLPTNLTEAVPEYPVEGYPAEAEATVPVASHARRRPSTGDTPDRVSPTERIADLEQELLTLQLAIVQTGGNMEGAHVNAAREYVTGWLDAVVAGTRKMPRALADHLAGSLKG